MTSPAHSIFLSYASQDAEIAHRLSDALRAAGIEVWFDQSELRGGDAWDQRIRGQIRDCALFVPVISSNTRSRHEGYFRLEWDLADQRSHMIARNRAFIVPVCTDETPGTAADVPESFLRVQWTRLAGGEIPRAFVERLTHLLAHNGSEPRTLAPVSAPPSAARSGSAKGWLLGLGLMAALVLLGGIYVARQGLIPSRGAAGTTATRPSAVPEQSVAVLPFVNMSADKDQEYFSDGLTEEMIDLLGRLPDLRVPARTSSFYFKGKNEPVADIAQQLKVAHVLEGSVRKAGKRLRITAQLIRADSGYHLWSETYDRDDKDIFAVQDDIARQVVKALQLRLAAGTPLSASRGTTNAEAYDQLLLGQQLFRHTNLDAYRHAAAAFERAISLDPNYAQAYAGLAVTKATIADTMGDKSALASAGLDADKAIALAPSDPSGYSARGLLRTYFFWDWSGALADVEKALSLDPRSSDVQHRYALILDVVGRLPEAIVAVKRATSLDPLSAQPWADLGSYYTVMRDYPAAEAAIDRALELEPKSDFALLNLTVLRLLQGKAQQALETSGKSENESFRLQGIAMAQHSLGHAQASQRALQELKTKHAQDAAFQIAEVHAWLGESDAAFQWLERAYRQRDGGLPSIREDPFFASVHADPRFNALLRKLRLPEIPMPEK